MAEGNDQGKYDRHTSPLLSATVRLLDKIFQSGRMMLTESVAVLE
jgi:hypothetical protein